ncbi:LLM class flavin-dependent oxidoreductase [Polymorphospora sp. NPDC050346]|uniref:LLM class flavin-dependent oxidoreductase n=1 Tax=Polymorphospora sp. NPDC050346 TaxID=3155780 RepID=UPI0033C6EE51
MTEKRAPRMSLMLSSAVPPDQTLAVARFAEQSRYSRLWITEDYFRKGAFSTAGAALAATGGIEVGLGIASLYVRSPATFAMEVATLDAMFPERFEAGIGLGSLRALDTLGRRPDKAIGSLTDRLRLLRSLLSGADTRWRDEFDTLDGVRLDYPATKPPRLWAAAESPQMLRMAARESDGLILSALSSPGYVSWVRQEIAPALAKRGVDLPIAAFVYTSVHDDEEVAFGNARELVAARLASGRVAPTLARSGLWEQIEPLLGRPVDDLRPRLGPEVVGSFVAYGTVASCRERLLAYAAAGVDEIALAPIPVAGKLNLTEVMPLLAQFVRTTP